MPEECRAHRLFIGAPFTTRLTGADGTFDPEYRRFLETMLMALRDAGVYDLYSAHESEGWGAALRTPDIALPADLKAVAEADIVIALDPHNSPGLLLELGSALTLGKPIVQLLPNSASGVPYLNAALGRLPDTYTIHYAGRSDCIRQLLDILRLLTAQQDSPT